MDTEAIKAACSVVFNEKGEILAVSRKDDPLALGLPGGGVEIGETLEETAIRETFEETNLKISKLEPIFTRKSSASSCRAFLAQAYEGTLYQKEKGIPQWVNPMRILDGPFKEYNQQLLLVLAQRGYDVFK